MELPAGFQPGDQLIVTYVRGGPSPSPTPTPAPGMPALGIMPVAAYQAPDLRSLGKVIFPIPATGALHNALWNVAVDALPVHPSSAAWLATIGAGPTSTVPIHPDFGAASYGAGVPINLVPGTQKLVPVNITSYASESDVSAAGYPVPDGAFVEAPTDSHLIVVDKDNWIAWEFYGFTLANGVYSAKQVSKWDLKVDAARTPGLTSADAAGLPILPGLVRYDEASAGLITHAFRWTCKPTNHGFVPPASHYSGALNPAAPNMGECLRLKASVSIATLPGTTTPTPPLVQTVLQAMKTYGLRVADNGSTGYVQGTPDARWDDSVMGNLKKWLIGRDFEFVDTGAVPVTSV